MGGDRKSNVFQYSIFGAFLIFAVVGVIMFALYRSTGVNSSVGTVLVWGTIPASQYDSFLEQYGVYDVLAENVSYTYKDPDTFDLELVEALASNSGPDIVLLTNEQITRNADRMFVTPYTNYPVRNFQDTYIEAAEVLLLNEGVIARPVAVDPLVLYWNRTLLANDNYPLPPKTWSEIIKMSQVITKKDDTKNILVSAIALGEFANIAHAKDILLTMFMQAGGRVTTQDADGALQSTLASRSSVGTQPMQDALRFFTEFSNPTRVTYSWNKARPEARDAFVAGDLALYIGYASELPLILAQNPNLNFDVTQIPQTSGGPQERQLTTARVYAYAVPLVAENSYGASILLEALTSATASQLFEQNTGLPSPRRELLAGEPTDAVKTVFRNSTIQAVSWRDPNPKATQQILAKMSNSVVSGTARMSEAIQRAQSELQAVLEL